MWGGFSTRPGRVREPVPHCYSSTEGSTNEASPLSLSTIDAYANIGAEARKVTERPARSRW